MRRRGCCNLCFNREVLPDTDTDTNTNTDSNAISNSNKYPDTYNISIFFEQ